MSKPFTEVERLKPECISCLMSRYLKKYPDNAPYDTAVDYMQFVLRAVGTAPKYFTSPVIVRDINAKRMELFQEKDDFSFVKQHFNEVMMAREDSIRQRIEQSSNPLLMAMQYSMIGNYIDYGAMQNVDEDYLEALLANAADSFDSEPTELVPAKKIDPARFQNLIQDLTAGTHLVFLTDNCGEVVMDKLFLEQIKKQFPHLEITVMVRGGEVLNDATLSDARQIGLFELANVIDNGNMIAGTWLPELSEEAKEVLNSADVILAKGQANFETLQECGLNIYYLFLCKCQMFANTFQVPRYTGILINDREI